MSFSPVVKVEAKVNKSALKEHMSASNRVALGDLPTTHENCKHRCGVSRPGKTARDRVKKG